MRAILVSERLEIGASMRYFLGGLVIAFIIIMLVGGLTGRARAKSCCVVADPAKDSRMRGA